jgi:hypothetical protein
MHIRKIVFRFVVDRVRRNNIIVTGWVIPKLKPTHRAKQRIKNALLHFALGVHLIQRSISYAL